MYENLPFSQNIINQKQINDTWLQLHFFYSLLLNN